ncbi:zf-DHHC-domain-containing protein [Hesseltinella vesiculosa]|uniref:Palmitoyltransferase n=1 Tax=Hesseltinella vesiculosa TaxID=101127 RepID=A0A1X2GT27_9FUNG|nr:zf-DHHC-domain-containing protein [Hesseltinella vesiculosa]
MALATLRKIQRCCTWTLNASPVILLALILSWAFWAYYFRLCLDLIANEHIAQGCLYGLFFLPLFVMTIWSYCKVTRTSPGTTVEILKKQDTLNDIEQGYQDSEYVQLLHHENEVAVLPIVQDHHDNDPNPTPRLNIDSDKMLDSSHTPPTLHTASSISTLQTSPSTRMLPPPSPMTPVSITVKRDGAPRFCQKCQLIKHDRSHHCRSCKRCVLKMDHHCPWVNNCVGFYNYKFFYLFIVYGALLCVYTLATTLPPTIAILQQPMGILNIDFNYVFLAFTAGVFALFLVPFSLFHTRQLCKNRTTIEFYEKANFRLGHASPSRTRSDIMRSKYFNPWDLGTRANVEQVLGKNPWQWFLPIGQPMGNGCQYPLSTYAYNTLAIDENEH